MSEMSEHLVGFGCSIAAPPIWLVISRVATSSGHNWTQTQIIPIVIYILGASHLRNVNLANLMGTVINTGLLLLLE